MKRKTVAILLAMTMVFTCVIPVLDPDSAAHAYTGKTCDEAIEWVESQLGVGIDYDGVYGPQCVDLIKAYYAYLGVGAVLGNGRDYVDNVLPEGWSRVEGGTPERGDILVYEGNASNEYGHVAIYESDYVTYHQNFNSHGYVERVTAYRYNSLSNPYWGYIRPDWADAVEPTEPPAAPKNLRTSDGESLYKTEDFIKFAWDPSSGTSYYSVYVLKDGRELYSANVGKLKSYTASPLEEGCYTFVVRAANSIGYSEDAVLDFEVNDAPFDPWWQIDRNATVTEVQAAKGQKVVDFTAVLDQRFTNSKKKLRADWYAGQDGLFAEDTPRFREEKTAEDSATSFTYSPDLSTLPEEYNSFQCIIRELGAGDEAETTISSDEIIFYLTREPDDPGSGDPDNPGGDPSDPSNPGQVDPSNPSGTPSSTVTPGKKPAPAPNVVKDLKALKIKKLKAAKKKATVSWKKLTKKEKSKIQGIEVQWSLNGFKTIAGTKTAKKTKTSLTIKGLKSKKKYWVRIRTYKKIKGVKHVSAWKTKTIKIK